MSDHQEHEHHSVNYSMIFGLLCVCTVLSIGFDLLKDSLSRPVLVVLILGVAVCKATFVLLYFMHIKFERAWKYVLLAPTTVLAIALPFALAPDMAFHYYTVVAPQREINVAELKTGGHGAHGAAHAGAHGADHAEEAHGEKTHTDEKPAAEAAPAEKAH